MRSIRIRAALGAVATILMAGSTGRPATADRPIRGVLARPAGVTAEAVVGWKAAGLSAVAVVLDESTRDEWPAVARRVAAAGLALYAWVEVGRNPTMAAAHPDWMATPGGHHDDWRKRFPDAPDLDAIKVWPWVPIGYAPAFAAHRSRIEGLLDGLPDGWSGAFLNDLQGGPSSCGCGNDQCRWALDYGTRPTAPLEPGDDPAARLVSGLIGRYPGRRIVPVWVTECQANDLPDADNGTGHCGDVPCATGACWERYAKAWDPLVAATGTGPVALGAWSTAFRRNPETWPTTAVALFRRPPKGGTALARERSLVVFEAWGRPIADLAERSRRADELASNWLLAIEPVDQSWEPRPGPAR